LKLLEKILLGIDIINPSDNIIENAIGLAKVFSSEIILIHVLKDDIKDEKLKLLLSEAVIKRLEEIRYRIEKEGVKASKPILEFGNHFDKIIRTADNINANIIVVGSSEKSKNDAFRLGVTAEKIIRKSNKPVWVVRNGKPLDVKNILCPVDFSLESKRALKNAIFFARRFKAELIIFSVCEIKKVGTFNLDWDKENERICEDHKTDFKAFLKGFNLTAIKWKKEIEQGAPASKILEAISKHKSGLLIMGTSGKSGLGKFIMGSETEKVIREVPTTFFTLKSQDIIDLQLETRIRDIESHYKTAKQLMKDGFLDESINQFRICLNINSMHLPSLTGISKVYEEKGDTQNFEKFKNLANDVLTRIWDRKIEAEIRRFYRF
jgi:nucleotide-binding universal stress UspA family protein